VDLVLPGNRAWIADLAQRALAKADVPATSIRRVATRGVPAPSRRDSLDSTAAHAMEAAPTAVPAKIADLAILVVSSEDGMKPQTKEAIKTIEDSKTPFIVAINKIDKPAADPHRTHGEVLDLFFELGATEEQANFETVYAIGREGIAKKNLNDQSDNLNPLLDVILEKVPSASGRKNEKMSAQVFNLGYDNFLGRMAVARIYSGKIKTSSQVFVKGDQDGKNATRKGKITKLFVFEGINRKETDFYHRKAESIDSAFFTSNLHFKPKPKIID